MNVGEKESDSAACLHSPHAQETKLTVPEHVDKLLLVVVEPVARRIINRADVDHDVAPVENFRVPRPDDFRAGVGRGAPEQRDAEGLIAVEGAVVGADCGRGGGHGGV